MEHNHEHEPTGHTDDNVLALIALLAIAVFIYVIAASITA